MFPDRVMSCKLILGEKVLCRRSLAPVGTLSSQVETLTGISLKKHSWDLFLAKCSMLSERWGSLQRGLFPAKKLICMNFPPLPCSPATLPLAWHHTAASHDFLDWLTEFTEHTALAVPMILAVAEARKHIPVNGSQFDHCT